MYKNIFNQLILKDKKNVSSILDAIDNIFHSDLLVNLIVSENRTIKYQIFNKHIFIFDKYNSNISIHYMYNYSNYTHDKIAEYFSDINNLHFYAFEYIYKVDLSYKQPKSFSDHIINYCVYQAKKRLKEHHIFSNNVYYFKLLIDFLNEKTSLTYSFNQKTLIDLLNPYLKNYNSYLYKISYCIKNCIEYCHRMNFFDNSNLNNDSMIFLYNNNLIFCENDYIYYVEYKDSINFNIYSINTNKYFSENDLEDDYKTFQISLIKNLENKIKNNQVDKFEDIIISLNDGKIDFIHPSYFSYIAEQLEYTNKITQL